jgi:hypothetical protein
MFIVVSFLQVLPLKLCMHVFYPMRDIHLAHLILPSLINITIFSEKLELLIMQFLQPIIFALLGPIFSSAPCSLTRSIYALL